MPFITSRKTVFRNTFISKIQIVLVPLLYLFPINMRLLNRNSTKDEVEEQNERFLAGKDNIKRRERRDAKDKSNDEKYNNDVNTKPIFLFQRQ